MPADPDSFDVVAWGCQNPAMGYPEPQQLLRRFYSVLLCEQLEIPPLSDGESLAQTMGTLVRYVCGQDTGKDCIIALDYTLGQEGMHAFEGIRGLLCFACNGQICSRFRVAVAEGSKRLPVGGVPLWIFSPLYDHPRAIWVHFRTPVTCDLVLQRSDGGAFHDVWLNGSYTLHVQDAQHVLFDQLGDRGLR
jgi:hypothetical protein